MEDENQPKPWEEELAGLMPEEVPEVEPAPVRMDPSPMWAIRK